MSRSNILYIWHVCYRKLDLQRYRKAVGSAYGAKAAQNLTALHDGPNRQRLKTLKIKQAIGIHLRD